MIRLVGWGAIFTGTVLALTGIGGWTGDGLRHWRLFLHTVIAPAFLICIAILGVAWVSRPLPHLQRLTSWTILGATVTGTTAMLLAMLPEFGQDTLHTLFEIHRWSAVALVSAAALHLVLRLVFRRARPTTPSASPEESPDVPNADAPTARP